MGIVDVKGIKDVERSKKSLVPMYRTALNIYSQIIINNFNTFVYYLPDSFEPEIRLRVDMKIIQYEELRGRIFVRLKGKAAYDFIRINIDMSKAKIIPPKKELEILPNSRSPIFPFVDIVPLADEVRINRRVSYNTLTNWDRGNFKDYRWFQNELGEYKESVYNDKKSSYDDIFKIWNHTEKRFYVLKR